jgi:hypothetical protein
VGAAATSGTMPPDAQCSATWLATTFAGCGGRLDEAIAGLVAGRLDARTRARRDRVIRASVRRRSSGTSSGSIGAPRAAPEARQPLAHAGDVERVRGHDQRVLAVVRVVARADADRPEAVLLVQAPRGHVRQADLERRLAGARARRAIEQAEQHPLADPAAAPARVDGEGRDVRLVDHDPQPGEADDRRRPRATT